MHTKVKEGHNKDETTRGAALRDLQRFFMEHDKDEGYAGLRRIADEDGMAVWTILKEKEVATQLQERTKERAQENGAASGLELANNELKRLKAENEKQKLLIDAAASLNKGTSCGCILS